MLMIYNSSLKKILTTHFIHHILEDKIQSKSMMVPFPGIKGKPV